MSNIIRVFNLGRLEYNKCLKIQKLLVKKKINTNDFKDSIILVEHDPTYTIGIRREKYKESDLKDLTFLKAQVEYTDRGGLITFHGPGQLVIYPILNLKNYKPSLKWYVSQLEQTVIDLCKTNFNLRAYRMCQVGYTGVWSHESKIAAIGIHFKNFVTYHGLAINCNVDLKWFDHIVPCGITDKTVSSLSKLVKKEVTIKQVIPLYIQSFENLFSAKLELASDKEKDQLIKEAQQT